MTLRPSLFLALLLSAGPAAAARVETVPELKTAPSVPSAPAPVLSASLSAAPLSLAAAAAFSAAPVAAPAAASPAALAAAPVTASALPASPAALAAAAAAPIPASALTPSRPALKQTLALPQPEYSKLGGAESAAAADKDFAARAQLDAPANDGALALAVPASASSAHPRLRLVKPGKAAPGPARAAVLEFPSPVGAVDRDGRLLRAALARLAAAPAGEPVTLDFMPTAASARALGEEGGALLTRSRADGRWRLIRGDGFSAASEDFDVAVLGRSTGEGWPGAGDVRDSDGRAARFLIASPGRLVEWNADVAPGAADALGGAAWRRAAFRAAAAVGLGPRALRLAGVAAEARRWERTREDVLEAGRAPLAERQMAGAVIPGWMRRELPITAARLGPPLTSEYTADVLARSKVWVYTWHSRWTYEVPGGLPDGHFDPRFGIRVMLKTDWRKLKDPETHFRVLWAHEYTHWLQNEGLVTNRYGIEIPPVAVEQLRAVELAGLQGLEDGSVGWMGKGSQGAFESGRKWAHGEMNDETALYWRGFLGGVAYEVGVIAGRPQAAWEFLNLVIAEKGGLKPREAFERVTGLKK